MVNSQIFTVLSVLPLIRMFWKRLIARQLTAPVCLVRVYTNLPVLSCQILIGCDSFNSTYYDIRIRNDKSTKVILTAKNVLDGIGL